MKIFCLFTSAIVFLLISANAEPMSAKEEAIVTPQTHEEPSNEGPFHKNRYPVLGVNIGTPGGLNLVAGYYFERYGFRVSGGGMPGMYGGTKGAQLNGLLKITEHPNFSFNASLLGGYSSIPGIFSNREWTYLGVGVDMCWHKFFSELSITAGHGDFTSPQVGLQIGYMYRFIKQKD